MWKSRLLLWARNLALHTPFERFLFHRYEYMYAPAQLAFLCRCLDDCRSVDGAFVEIGCAFGHTTVFLNKHMDFSGIEKEYICLDTFSGFSAADVAAERTRRGEAAGSLTAFRYNDIRWFERTLRRNGVSRVTTIQGDVTGDALDGVDRIAFCLIDVDLYRPVRIALEKTLARLQPGGLILVDDCTEGGHYEGARQAYLEFVSELGAEPDIRLGKLGLLRRGELE